MGKWKAGGKTGLGFMVLGKQVGKQGSGEAGGSQAYGSQEGGGALHRAEHGGAQARLCMGYVTPRGVGVWNSLRRVMGLRRRGRHSIACLVWARCKSVCYAFCVESVTH
eukprot:95678-Chlamydomonas_euryale.AAC.3